MGPFVFLDIETTGIDPSREHIIEVACIKWADGEVLGKFESLVNPGVPIPREVSIITGIADVDVKNAPKFSEIKKTLFDFIGDLPIAGHNIAFDMGFLKMHHASLKNPEIDTVALARILLGKEPSYALEVLMSKYFPSNRGSHRAMADTETALAFFDFLLGRIAEIPEEAMNSIIKVLGKSDWAGKQVFFERKIAPHKKAECLARRGRESSDAQSATIMPANAPQWNDEIIGNFSGGAKIILQSSAELPLAAFKNQPVIIAYSSFRKRNALIFKAKSENIPTMVLKEPQFYLSPSKLNEKLEAPAVSAEETPFLLKLILWSAETLSGDRDEITLAREEYGMFESVADAEGTDTFWEKALKQASNSTIVILHHAAFAKGLAAEIARRVKIKPGLIILEAGNLEDNFSFALQQKYTIADLQPHFGKKAVIIFGLLGIFHSHFSSPDAFGFNGSVIMDQNARQSIEWKRFIEAVNNLPSCKKKDEIAAALNARENHVQWINSFADEVSYCSAPVALGGIFQKNIEPFEKIIVQSDALSGDESFSFIKDIFELDSTWEEFKHDMNPWFGDLHIEFAKDFPEPNTGGYFSSCVKLFNRIIESKKGRVVFILNSKKTVEAIYQALIPISQKSGARLLAVGYSGGAGKSVSLFLANPDSSVLLSTHQILAFFGELEPYLDTIVFQKIAFDYPDNPLASARANQFENGFNQYTLQRAIIRFRELLIELGKMPSNGQPKTCWILDSRLHTRDYGKMFL